MKHERKFDSSEEARAVIEDSLQDLIRDDPSKADAIDKLRIMAKDPKKESQVRFGLQLATWWTGYPATCWIEHERKPVEELIPTIYKVYVICDEEMNEYENIFLFRSHAEKKRIELRVNSIIKWEIYERRLYGKLPRTK